MPDVQPDVARRGVLSNTWYFTAVIRASDQKEELAFSLVIEDLSVGLTPTARVHYRLSIVSERDRERSTREIAENLAELFAKFHR